MYLPNDPDMLVSVINTRLRDFYENLDDLCLSEDVDREELLKKLADSGFRYDGEQNRFVKR